MAALEFQNVSHAYGRTKVVNDISFTVEPGELVCLLGPSGCGKTTLLRLAAGLEPVQEGRILMGNTQVAGEGVHVPPESRNLGLMFQDYALFPHLTVMENIAFGLEGRRKRSVRNWGMKVLARVGLEDYADAYPHMLSGGQQQRAALVRAMAPQPSLMLLDEPFSGLDVTRRFQMREETYHILKESGVAALIVTHDPEEAMFMSDKLVVMSQRGRVVQIGTPDDVYLHPADTYVADLHGPGNFLKGTVRSSKVTTPLGPIKASGFESGQDVDIYIRPEGFRFSESGAKSGIPVEVTWVRPLGKTTHVHFVTKRGRQGADEDEVFHCHVPSVFNHEPGDVLKVRLDPKHVFMFPAE